ncbi:type VI secretion system baseplate subunit TssG [Acidobacteria bacterium AB60]|nr:type VI secretion system baseplate subunit TssG [Acidobacteria bacterium AB60]
MGAEVGTPSARLSETTIGAELQEDPCSFEFFQAVALLERLRTDMRAVGGFSSPDDEAVRFEVNPRLGFPASEIQEMRLTDEGPAEMMVNFMGLTGPSGVLPHPYSELILERQRGKDRTLSAFLDIFNHRAISLFYRAWQRSRFPVSYAAGTRDYFTQYLRDLLGIGTADLQDRQEVEDEALMHYISLIVSQSRSAVALEQLLADYFQVPVEVQQFTGAWYSLDERTQCQMDESGSLSTQMGGAVVGDAVWDRQSSVRLRIGPLTLERYNDFLPKGSAHKALRAITQFFGNDCFDFQVQLVLDRTQVPSIKLDLNEERPARLGWVSWAKTAPLTRDPDEAILAL